MQDKFHTIQQLQQAILQTPDNPALHYDLGATFLAINDTKAAEKSYVLALELAPNHPQILLQLGNTANQAGQYQQAIQYFEACITVNPQQAAAHYNLGNAQRELGLLNEAATSFLNAIAINPADADCHNNLGNVYREQGQLDKAIICYQTALSINPLMHHARMHLIHQMQHCCQWELIDHHVDLVKQALNDSPDTQLPPFAFLAMPSTTMQEQLRCANAWASSQFTFQNTLNKNNNTLKSKEKNIITVAYLSSDFRLHPLAFLITELLANHNRQRFKIVAYSANGDVSEANQRIQASVDEYVNITKLNDLQVAQRMLEDNIDILVDLTGYTKNSRSGVASYKPAPISINWLGYPGTMGKYQNQSLFDYILVDKTVAPNQDDFSETCLYLPCYQPNDTQRPIGKRSEKSQHNLPSESFVFCCFNQTFKITRDVFTVWMQLLKDVPNSVLWLLECNTWAKHNLLNAAQIAGISPSRIVFAPRMPIDAHLARHDHADLFLDTLPYNAHTTASDALWMNLPIVTCLGNTFSGRVTASLLRSLVLDNLITHDLASYYQKALQLATQPQTLSNTKNTLQKNKALLFNQATFTQNLEKIYLEIYNSL
jgi:protein O-GlcNAc transferase